MQLASDLTSLQSLATFGALDLDWGSGRLTLRLATDGSGGLIVTEHTDGDPNDLFVQDEIETGVSALRGNTEAALHLTGSWQTRIDVDPARIFKQADDAHSWIVVEHPDDAADLLMSRNWWQLKSLVQPERPLVVAIHQVDTQFAIYTDGVRMLALTALGLESLVELSPPQELPGLGLVAAPEGTPDPRILFPLQLRGPTEEVHDIARALWRQATASCWAHLASSVRVADNRAELEFFGLQRKGWELGSVGPDLATTEHQAVMELWRSCFGGENPDRLLAARQVISLYSDPPWSKALDIDRSSQPLYIAMRSEASAESLRTQREARALALAIARQTADATAGLTRSTFERTIASFAALGAIIVGKTTKALTEVQATNLRHLLGIFLLIMAFWSFLLEGRTVTSGIGAFPSDLAHFSSLLSDTDRREILATESLLRAKRQAWLARIVVPIAYVAAAVVAFAVTG